MDGVNLMKGALSEGTIQHSPPNGEHPTGSVQSIDHLPALAEPASSSIVVQPQQPCVTGDSSLANPSSSSAPSSSSSIPTPLDSSSLKASFDRCQLKATLHSLSGKLKHGDRGSLVDQLNSGIRVFEFEIISNRTIPAPETEQVPFVVGGTSPGEGIDLCSL